MFWGGGGLNPQSPVTLPDFIESSPSLLAGIGCRYQVFFGSTSSQSHVTNLRLSQTYVTRFRQKAFVTSVSHKAFITNVSHKHKVPLAADSTRASISLGLLHLFTLALGLQAWEGCGRAIMQVCLSEGPREACLFVCLFVRVNTGWS